MRERRVVLLARDLVWADDSGGSLPFSYAARKLDASIRSAPDLADVPSTVVDLRTDDVGAFFERIRELRPTVVMCSTYVWSIGFFCELAERIKEWDPSVQILMGGPAARPSVLALPPYAPYAKHVDAVATGEGEEVVREVARKHLDEDWTRTVRGLTTPSALGWRRTEPAERPVLDDYASPYQLGVVPKGEMGFLETFRGCPISCAFCQWGDERADRVHSAEYLAGHLRGIDAADTRGIFVCDAAFNLSGRAFRNLVAAENEVGALAKRQLLGHVYPSHLREEHLAFFDHVKRVDMAIGVQSFDADVLKRLGRPFDMARFESVLGELRKRTNIDLELILGLPGDDAASFRRTFEKALALASTVRVFYCLALPDALLERAAEFDVDFDPETFMVRSCTGWTKESLAAEWAHVQSVARTMRRPSFGPNWVDFLTESAPKHPDDAGAPIATKVTDKLRDAVRGEAIGWELRGARLIGERVVIELATHGGTGRVHLHVTRARDGQRRFTERDGIAYSYRGSLGREDASALERLIHRMHGDVRTALFPDA